MKRLLCWSMAAVLLSGSCAAGPETTDEPGGVIPPTSSPTVTTSSSRVPNTPTTTSTVPDTTTTTTTTAAGPVDISIDDEPMTTHDIEWEEGVSYVATRFFSPLAFVSPADGWVSRGAGERWVSLVWTSSESGATVSLNFLAYRQGLQRHEVADSILEIEGVDLVSGPMSVTVSGYDAITFDVLGQQKDSALEEYQCTIQLGRWNWDSSGYPLVPFTEESEDGWEYGIPACFRSRLWIVDSDAGPVTVVATPLDPGRYEELVSMVDPLLATVSVGN